MNKVNHIHTEQIDEKLLPAYLQAAQDVGNISVKLVEADAHGQFPLYIKQFDKFSGKQLNDTPDGGLEHARAQKGTLHPGNVAIEIAADYDKEGALPFFERVQELTPGFAPPLIQSMQELGMNPHDDK